MRKKLNGPLLSEITALAHLLWIIICLKIRKMVNKIVLYAIHGLSPLWDDDAFDKSLLPFTVLPNVTIEDVSSFINEEAFQWAKSALGSEDFKTLTKMRYAITYRYQTVHINRGDEDATAEVYITNIAACLRLIRPMRQTSLVMQGQVTQEGTFDLQHFDHPILLEVPEVQKLFHLRKDDLGLLKLLVPSYLTAMMGEYWKIRLAIQYHDGGHWEDRFWKPRFTLWVSGVDALYATHDSDHSGRLVVSERVKHFLGADTNIYEPGDIRSYLPQAQFTVAEIIDDVYEVRNLIVHGERVPTKYSLKGRDGVSGEINRMSALRGPEFHTAQELDTCVQGQFASGIYGPEILSQILERSAFHQARSQRRRVSSTGLEGQHNRLETE